MNESRVLCAMLLLGILPAASGLAAPIERGERAEIMFGRGNPTDTAAEVANPIPIDPWRPPEGGFKIVESPDGFELSTPAANLVFSHNTCNIVESSVLGTPLGDVAYPNLVVKIDGVTYSQNNSRSGTLQTRDAGDFQIIRGTFDLTAASSTPSYSPTAAAGSSKSKAPPASDGSPGSLSTTPTTSVVPFPSAFAMRWHSTRPVSIVVLKCTSLPHGPVPARWRLSDPT